MARGAWVYFGEYNGFFRLSGDGRLLFSPEMYPGYSVIERDKETEPVDVAHGDRMSAETREEIAKKLQAIHTHSRAGGARIFSD
jgi:hypothetical protein